MVQDDFDLEAALRNVHPAGQRGRIGAVEQAHVFLPASMRAEQGTRAEQTRLPGPAARRRFAANGQRADEQAPRVGYDLVEVVRPVSCSICQQFLQGQRAVRVWGWSPVEQTWTAHTLQCCRHPRPGVPLGAEMAAKYFAPACAHMRS